MVCERVANPKLFFLQGEKAVVHSEFRVVMTLLRLIQVMIAASCFHLFPTSVWLQSRNLFPMDELLLNLKLPGLNSDQWLSRWENALWQWLNHLLLWQFFGPRASEVFLAQIWSINSAGRTSAGMYHTVLLRSDGHAVACGSNTYGQCSIPDLPPEKGMKYTQVSAGGCHTVLLRSDGSVVTSGSNFHAQCEFSPLYMKAIPYTHVDAGTAHTVLLRSDGLVAAYGSNHHGQCDIPALDGGFSYTQVAAGAWHTVLLRSDGRAVPCGERSDGQCDIPPLAEGIRFTQVSAGSFHTVLLRSDGCAVACGSNEHGQCNIPALKNGMSYIQVSGGSAHTVLLRSDGCAVAVGRNQYGQCNIPPLGENMSYIQVYAGGFHSVFLRSDGVAVASGWNHHGQCDIPTIKKRGCVYVADPARPRGKDLILQVDFAFKDLVSVTWICSNLAGAEKLRFEALASDLASDIHSRIASDLNVSLQDLQLVLPDGQLVLSIYAANPKATVRMVVPKDLAPWWQPPSEPPPAAPWLR